MTKLETLAKKTRDDVIDREVELGPEDGARDLQPAVNERAYEAVDSMVQPQGDDPTNTYIDIIEEYLADDDRGGLEGYNAVDFFDEFHDTNEGDIRRTLKGMAASCVMHRVMDDLGALGLAE